MPELVTLYSFLLEKGRKNHATSFVRTLKRMARNSNLQIKRHNQFLVCYALAKNPTGLTVKGLITALHGRLSREATYRALSGLRKTGLISAERKKEESAHTFQRSFVVYHLTEKGRKGIVLQSPKRDGPRVNPLTLLRVKDRYGHHRRARPDDIRRLFPFLLSPLSNQKG